MTKVMRLCEDGDVREQPHDAAALAAAPAPQRTAPQEDEEEEEGPGGEGGLLLLAGAAGHAGDDGGRRRRRRRRLGGAGGRGGRMLTEDDGGAPRRSTPADRAARADRGRAEIAADDAVPDAPVLKRRRQQTGRGGAHVGKSGRHGTAVQVDPKLTVLGFNA